MPIHHDKKAYGKLAPSSEELTDQAVFELLASLQEMEEDDGENVAKNCKKKNEKE